MITPKAFGNIIKHFDEIDKIVSARTTRKRPWLEVALTSILCDLLDEETQEEEKLNYTLKHLQEDLNKEDGLFGISLSLETIEYNPTYESYISQSDIGIKIVFDNKIEPASSWTKPFLLQAKRLSPKTINPLLYTEASSFTSLNKGQQKRIGLLNKILGASYLKYLLYCPRPDQIDNESRIKLAYLRTKALSYNIFDYTWGLEVYKELQASGETLKSGIFITDTENASLNFGEVHSKILQETFPFSWFIALNFFNHYSFLKTTSGTEIGIGGTASGLSENHKLVEGILSGDKEEVDKLIEMIKETESIDLPENIQILPKHVITIRYSVGEQIDPDRRRIRQ